MLAFLNFYFLFFIKPGDSKSLLGLAVSEPPRSPTSWTEDFTMPRSWVIPRGSSADLSDWVTIWTTGLFSLFFQVKNELTRGKLSK